MLQASETTAQGLWLAAVCGTILGLVIWFGGPLAVASMASAWLVLLAVCCCNSFSPALYDPSCNCQAAHSLLHCLFPLSGIRGMNACASHSCCTGLYCMPSCTALAGMGAQAEVAQMAVTYLRWRSIAAPVSLAMFVATGSFRGFKDTRSALPPPSLCVTMRMLIQHTQESSLP